jgi:hypothetical protein
MGCGLQIDAGQNTGEQDKFERGTRGGKEERGSSVESTVLWVWPRCLSRYCGLWSLGPCLFLRIGNAIVDVPAGKEDIGSHDVTC